MFGTITIFLLNEKIFALIVILTFKDFLTFQKKPGLISLSALVLFDNTKRYTEYRDSVIHHQKPQQLQMRVFVNNEGCGSVLIHYKSWCSVPVSAGFLDVVLLRQQNLFVMSQQNSVSLKSSSNSKVHEETSPMKNKLSIGQKVHN